MLHDRNLAATRAAPRRGPFQRLLEQVAQLAGGQLDVLVHRERAWASATFSGTRHHLTLAFAGAGGVARGERLIAALPDHEFAIPGQLVADAAIVEVDQRHLPEPHLKVVCELLLLEDR
ncbi:MAG TPA: hypothetical protein VI199_08045 [Novosphingobium sp.]